MLFGIDPLYAMIILVAGLIVVVLIMGVIMFRMVRLLEGIYNEAKTQSGHLRAFTPASPFTDESNTVRISPRLG